MSGRPPLTERERDAVGHAADGLSYKEIGRLMFLSAGSVKSALNRARAKFDARNTTELCVLAVRSGQLP